jgi:HprK-related kinase B
VTGPAALASRFDTPLTLALEVAGVPLVVRTNDSEIWTRLAAYYAPYVVEAVAPGAVEVRLVQGTMEPRGTFRDVKRAEGRPVKEAVQDLPGGRLILKRATGVVMGLWSKGAFAMGDLRTNLNQGINLVNACYAKRVVDRGHVLLHASAVSRGGRTVVLAGPPGAGKSTSALHLVEAGFRFLSNDRVLVRAVTDGVEALGYPKQPRVNPGTLLHHPRLHTLLKPEEREALAALSPRELWRLERKSDVDVDAIYGAGTVDLRGRKTALVLLKWRLDGEGFSIRRLELAEAMADLPLFQKDLGVFDPDRPPGQTEAPAAIARYAAVLEQVTLLEVTGRINFPGLVDLVADVLGS